MSEQLGITRGSRETTPPAQRIPAERRRLIGKEMRARLPRKAQGPWTPPRSRRDPVDALVEADRGRLKRLLPMRYGRMIESPFAFLRGTAAIMAGDLALQPDTGIRAQSCGDCHLANFGVFATPERNLNFDINDFDETLPASFEWDVKRLAVSFFLAGKGNGFPGKAPAAIAQSVARNYRKAAREFARMSPLDLWYARSDAAAIRAHAPDAGDRPGGRPRPAAQASSGRGIAKLKIADEGDGSGRIVDKPPLIFHPPEKWRLEERFVPALADYRESLPADRRALYDRFRPQDVAVKVVGVGSVGTRCLIVLFGAEKSERLVLQVKEALPSVLEPYAGAGEYRHQGERIVAGQRIMQSASDLFLGWMTERKDGREYYVRQWRDMKYVPDAGAMPARRMLKYAGICGRTLARAHARGGDAVVIDGYLGRDDAFDRAIGEFARQYARQVESDYGQFLEAIRSGRLPAATDRKTTN